MTDSQKNKQGVVKIIEDTWLILTPMERAQHTLSNSTLYQQIQLHRQLLNEFKRLEEQQRDASE
jgi:tRNA uridine 5-carbamoylmethylation protein Kti12